MKFTDNQLAFRSNALPCNPLPFLSELMAGCKLESGFIHTPGGHMLMLTLNMMAYGSLFSLDSSDELCRLSKYVEDNIQPEIAGYLTGTDVSKEISLLEYGLLVAPYTKDGNTDEYFCVYRISEGKFDTGFKRESELNDLINGKEWASETDIDSFLSTLGMTKDEWLKQSFVHKLSDCLNYGGWGYQNIMGECYNEGLQEREVRKLYL